MTNATVGALLPFLLAWLAYRAHQANQKWVGRTAASVCLILLCCIPWTVRNYSVFHTFVPLRSVLGLQLWLGNNDHTQNIFRGDLHPIYNTDEREHYIALGEIAYMQEKKDAAIEYMMEHPGREAQLISRRFISIWSGGTPYPVTDFVESTSWWFRYVVVFNLLAAATTLYGIVILFLRRNVYAFPIATFPLIYPCAFYLTLALPRYRLPIDPIVMLLSAVSLRQLLKRTDASLEFSKGTK